jgi:tRNA A-37 threonylcarbamoyl transferase component Bud32
VNTLSPEDITRVQAVRYLQEQRVQIIECSVGKVVVKGQRPPRSVWRGKLLGTIASALGLPLLRAAPAPGGAAAQQTEVARLRALHALGLPVPEVLYVGIDRMAMQYLSELSLSHEWHANQLPKAQQLALWEQGAQALAQVHARGQYLSQAFARNAIDHAGKIWFIDFEDDPLQVMTLSEAQARDWLAYLHSSVYILSDLNEQMLQKWELLTQSLRGQTAQMLLKQTQRLAWLRYLPTQRRIWGRDLVATQALWQFLYRWASQHKF